jgi:hypothetical protein
MSKMLPIAAIQFKANRSTTETNPRLISSASPAIVCHMEKRTEEWLRQSDYAMDKAAVVNIVHRFQQGLEVRGIKVERVILYGSYAAAANKAGSDIDPFSS